MFADEFAEHFADVRTVELDDAAVCGVLPQRGGNVNGHTHDVRSLCYAHSGEAVSRP